jgi:hypothetical protein
MHGSQATHYNEVHNALVVCKLSVRHDPALRLNLLRP